LSDFTVAQIVRGEHGWAERKDSPLFRKYLDEQKQAQQHAWTRILGKTLEKIETKLDNPADNASLSQLFMGAGISQDKVFLHAGQPTQITANLNINAVVALDKLAAMCAQRLVDENQTPVESQQNGDIPAEAIIIPPK
jgi:hypothetical protein